MLRFRDDGPGLPDELFERVFEPFFRAEASRSRETGGSGLGLTIARGIARTAATQRWTTTPMADWLRDAAEHLTS